MWNSKPVVAIFGSSRIIEGDGAYEEARLLGRLLARAGFVICNGGYAGSMEATARGASEMEGVSIGLTLKAFGARNSNPFLSHEIQSATLFERLSHFAELAEAFIVLSGGIGTLAELFTTWNMAQINGRTAKPIILVGGDWPDIVDRLRGTTEIRDKDMKFLQFVSTPEEAMEALKEQLRP